MDLAMQIISIDQFVRIYIVQDLKVFNTQSLSTQAKKREQLVSLMPAIKKAFELMGDDIVELSTENESLKNQLDGLMKNGWKNLKQNFQNRLMMRKEQN